METILPKVSQSFPKCNKSVPKNREFSSLCCLLGFSLHSRSRWSDARANISHRPVCPSQFQDVFLMNNRSRMSGGLGYDDRWNYAPARSWWISRWTINMKSNGNDGHIDRCRADEDGDTKTFMAFPRMVCPHWPQTISSPGFAIASQEILSENIEKSFFETIFVCITLT